MNDGYTLDSVLTRACHNVPFVEALKTSLKARTHSGLFLFLSQKNHPGNLFSGDHTKLTALGLTSWEKSPDGKVLKSDVSIAKNYLSKEELESLGRIVGAYLDLAEDRALRKIPMTMNDWATRLDRFLEMTDREVLKDAGKVTAQFAKEFAESEFEKYRIIQDHLFESDFDKLLKITSPTNESKLKKKNRD